MAPGQEAISDDYGNSFDFLYKILCFVYSVESPQ